MKSGLEVETLDTRTNTTQNWLLENDLSKNWPLTPNVCGGKQQVKCEDEDKVWKPGDKLKQPRVRIDAIKPWKMISVVEYILCI